jgi:hypothetical protein
MYLNHVAKNKINRVGKNPIEIARFVYTRLAYFGRMGFAHAPFLDLCLLTKSVVKRFVYT